MKFELRDLRNGFLWIPNSLFDTFVSKIQPSSIVVYLTLARFVNNQTQECFPSYDLIEQKTGFSRPTVAACLQELRAVGAIDWRKEGRKNIYSLLEMEATSKKSELVKSDSTTSSKSFTNQLSPLNSNKTYNKTQEQDSILDSQKQESSSEFSLQTESFDNQPKKETRSQPFREKLIKFWAHLNHSKKLYWTGADGKQLSEFLKRNAEMTIEEFHEVLLNYQDSENVINSKTPHQFLPTLNLYFDGPLNKYSRPIEEKRT
jgi:hypothetical protein